MDPVTALGAAGSVVGIAGFGIQLSQILTKYVDRFLSAQESLQKIVDEIDSTSHALKEVYLLIREELDNFESGNPLLLFTETSLLNVKQTADQCLVIFWRIEATIEATISGDSSANTKEKLIKKLNDFNKLNSYSSNFPIAIELRPISKPLDSRQKTRWTTNVSKLEDYCEQLRRLKINLTLTFQVISLGHQRSQSKPTVEDFHLIVKTYAIISQIATQDELRAIANQAQRQSQTLHGKAERPAKPSKPAQSPSRATKNVQSGRSALHREPLKQRNTTRSTTQAPRTGAMPFPAPPSNQPNRKPVINTPDNEQDLALNPPSGPAFTSQTQTALVNGQSGNDFPKPQLNSRDPQRADNASDGEAAESTPNTQNRGTNGSLNSVRPQSGLSAEMQQLHKRDQPFSQPTSGDPVHEEAKAHNQAEEKRAAHGTDVQVPKVEHPATNGQKSNKETRVLPFIISDQGAYPLPISLGSELKRNFQGGLHLGQAGKRLSKKLAFLSPEQFQTVQTVLQQMPGDDAGKLAHLELVKKRGTRFWRRSQKVPIAFVEKDTGPVPKSRSIVLQEPTDIGANPVDTGQGKNVVSDMSNHSAAMNKSSETELQLPRVETSSTPAVIANHLLLPLGGHRQNIVSHIQTTTPIPHGVEIPGFQNFKHLLVNERDWRERFTEYKVWTIRPLHSDQSQTLPDQWNRCMLSEELIDITQIRLRIAALDQHAATILEKLAALTISQQIQVMRSVEAAKTGDARLQNQWKLRQLEVLRTRRLFKQNHVKAITVYAYKEPPAQAFEPAKEPPGNPPLSSSTVRSRTKKKTRLRAETRENESGSGSESSASTATTSRININVHGDQNKPKRSNPRYYDYRYDSSKSGRETMRSSRIDRANEAISSRRPVPPPSAVPPPPPRPAIPPSYAARTARSTNTVQPTIVINNRVAYDSDDSSRENEIDYSSDSDHDIIVTKRTEEKSPTPYGRTRTYYDPPLRNREIIRVREDQDMLRDNTRRFSDRSPPDVSPPDHRNRRRDTFEENVGRQASTSVNLVPRDRDANFPPSSHRNRRPRRSRSPSVTGDRGNLLRYYNPDELRGRARERFGYPVDFDRQLYDPQASTEAMNEAMNCNLEVVEQLLIEWTPQHETANQDGDNDDEDISPSTKHLRESASNNGLNTDAKRPDTASTGISDIDFAAIDHEHTLVPMQNENLPHPDAPVDTEEAHPITTSQPTADSKSEKTLINQDQEGQAPDRPAFSANGEPSNSHAANNPPFRRPQRRETTDGNNLAERPPPQANTLPVGNSDDIGIRMFNPSQRVSTMPTPNRQAWTGIEWARQIVEDTASIAVDHDDENNNVIYEPPPIRSPDRHNNASSRNTNYRSTRSPPLTDNPLNDRNITSNLGEQRFRGPPRRRTVEFDERASRRSAPERVRAIERRDPPVRYRERIIERERDRDSVRDRNLEDRIRELERENRDIQREREREFAQRQRDRELAMTRERLLEREFARKLRESERDRDDIVIRRGEHRY